MGPPRLQEENVLRLGLYAPAFRLVETWISEKPRIYAPLFSIAAKVTHIR